LRNKTKSLYYGNEEIGQLLKKYLKWISSKDPQDRIEFKRMQGYIIKMIKEERKKRAALSMLPKAQ
jgi:hypothetical protein